ncbi:helix-turn-helix domain-containing protein [Sphingobium sp.]|uniref:helix-turn-helix domain-containing protein n=1 Tax=Sphingobium sp. TaxID=1912891 RepID=UPI0028BF065E|nr:helix-turn-helix domain-containing protein [Sphingobium sp.]
MNQPPILLTETEAAECLRVCTRTLRKARQAGQLHYILIGRAVRYTLADLESYVEQLRQVQPACPPTQPTRRISVPRQSARGVIVPFTERNPRR